MSGTAVSISAEQLRLVLEVSRVLAVSAELDPLLLRIAESACRLLACERASIFLHDPATAELVTRVALGSREIRVPQTAGIVGAAFTANQSLLVADPYNDPRFNPEPDRKSGFVTRNLLSAPMPDLNGRPVGVIQAVNKLASAFGPTDTAMIELLAAQAGVALQRYRLQQSAVDAAALQREMDLAREVQQAMIPKTFPQVPGLQAAGWTRPASTTGGDAFDLWTLPDGRLAILLADASGHGIAPALVVSQVRTLARILSEREQDPSKIFHRINARMADDLEAGRFITAFLGFANGNTGQLLYASAGHGPLLLVPAPGQPSVELEQTSPPLGILPDLPQDPPRDVTLQPGGLLAVISDGIFESFSPTNEQFSAERVGALLSNHATNPPEPIINALRTAVLAWQKHDEPKDDQTAVLVRRV